MSFTNEKEHLNKVLSEIMFNNLRNENEILKKENKRIKKLIDYLILAFLTIVYFFVYMMIKY